VDLSAARAAQQAWRRQPVRARLEVLRRFRFLVAGETDAAVDMLRGCRSAPPAELLSSEILPLLDGCRFLELQAERLLAPQRPSNSGRPQWLGGVTLEILREPYGIVLVLGPANYPLFLAGMQTLQALVAGNAVALKPGVGAAVCATWLAERLHACGLGDNLLTVLPDSVATAQDAIASGVDMIVLTGSADTGRAVLGQAAATLTPVTAELSGCDALFVGPGADVDRVAKALAFTLRLNRGQTCMATRRVYVPSGQMAALEQKLTLLLAGENPVPLGGASAGVAAAVAAGARLVAGSVERGPTVLAAAPVGSELLGQSVMAPVLCLQPVRDDADALQQAAACPYALSVSLWGDEAWAARMAEDVRAGVVIINDVIAPTADPRVPFGGRGASGFGVTRGAEGLLEMTVPKAIQVQRAGTLYHLEPPAASDYAILQGFTRFAHGASLGERCQALIEMITEVARERRRKARLARSSGTATLRRGEETT
jgi:acyl-CoA reductase-like NAD-dependent aldehyde dehydrogenase